MVNMRVPPNYVTFPQKFADNVGANEARDTSNLPVVSLSILKIKKVVHEREWLS